MIHHQSASNLGIAGKGKSFIKKKIQNMKISKTKKHTKTSIKKTVAVLKFQTQKSWKGQLKNIFHKNRVYLKTTKKFKN
jgi:hypothetical protein